MKMMAKIMLLGICVAWISIQSVMSMTISTVNGFGPYQRGSGGEFTLLPSDGVDLSLYSSLTKNVGGTQGTFQSFCVEHDEYISGNTTYAAQINDVAVDGGAGGPSPDPLSLGTAFLYKLFASGSLVGYDYTRNNSSVVQALQNAIWYLEEEISLSKPLNNIFLNYVNGQIDGGLAAAMGDNNGTYNVGVLNLTDRVTGRKVAQDQLVMVPVPDGGITVLLLGLVLGCLGFVSRRLRK